MFRYIDDKKSGCSVRCLKDEGGSSATLPTVITASVTNITHNSATSGGDVTADGGANVTARGVCWSTSQNPTIADSHTTDGSGTGSFTSGITYVTDPTTTYYVRAYATNSKGTAYGEEVSFTTAQVYPPTVTTNSVTNVTHNSATSGGDVISDGGANVTARGVCWSTNQNPTIADSHTADSSGTGSFVSSITGLTSNTTYYVRAYATNSVGTAYGNQVNFTIEVTTDGQPCPGAEKVTDYDNNEYNTVKIGNQCWMKENLKTTMYANGNNIDTSKMFNPGDNANNVATYGLLYTWSAVTRDSSTTYPADGQVKVQGICPAGWHVPSDAEFDTLTKYVFNSTSPEYKCGKDCGEWKALSNVSCIANALSSTTGWSSNNNSGCNAGNTGDKANATGFSAVPAGYCYIGSFSNFGGYAYFWSATQLDGVDARYRYLRSDASNVYRIFGDKANGFSVRCLRD